MKITIFSEELRKCLNAAGMSDCGENDTWNYWYQRLMNAYNESVERQIMTEQTENAKLRELCAGLLTGYECGYGELCKGCTWDGLGDSKTFSCLPRAKARDLGVEVDA